MSDLLSLNSKLKIDTANAATTANTTASTANTTNTDNKSVFATAPSNDTRTKTIDSIMDASKNIGLAYSSKDVLNELSDDELAKMQKYMDKQTTAVVNGETVDTTKYNVMHLNGFSKAQIEHNLKVADRNNEIQEGNLGQRFIDAYKAANDGQDPRDAEAVNPNTKNNTYDDFYWGEDPKKALEDMVAKAKAANPDFVDQVPETKTDDAKAQDTTKKDDAAKAQNSELSTVANNAPEEKTIPTILKEDDGTTVITEITPEVTKAQDTGFQVNNTYGPDEFITNDNGDIVKMNDNTGKQITDVTEQKSYIQNKIDNLTKKIQGLKDKQSSGKVLNSWDKVNIFRIPYMEESIKDLKKSLDLLNA